MDECEECPGWTAVGEPFDHGGATGVRVDETRSGIEHIAGQVPYCGIRSEVADELLVVP